MSIEIINDLSMRLVADDFSNGHASVANNGGPTKTARAMAIIHLAAHDAYAQVTAAFPAMLSGLPPKPAGSASDDAAGTVALLAAGFRAAERLYPDFGATIAMLRPMHSGFDPVLVAFGMLVGDAWVNARAGDGSANPQEDTNYDNAPGRHRPDPFNPAQKTLGRTWGAVRPFVIGDVATDAPLGPPPALNSQPYADAYKQVYENGSANLTERNAKARHMAAVGIFWAYDGANKLGTPPRLYNQVVREIPALKDKTLSHPKRIRLLTAINAAMADAGIAAWHWKYEYDVWRPIVGIREADAGWGPTGAGDGNTLRKIPGNPFWRPLGAPRSNPIPGPVIGPLAQTDNFTPNFPAYPSGHATFGTACFETAAKLLGKKPKDVSVKFVSGEFNGATTDNKGVTRPQWEQTFTLKEAIEQNSISRIFLGVHWEFDATGGELVGRAVAEKTGTAFT